MPEIKLLKGDCLKLMNEIPDKSIDLILCDLPYGITACQWDSVIDLNSLWQQYKRILKFNGTAVLFGNQPFTTALINSNLFDFSHIWYWKKNNVTNGLQARKMPMRCIEDICVFRCNRPPKNNQGLHENLRKYFFNELKKSGLRRKDIDKMLNNSMSSHYFTKGQQFSIPSKENYRILQKKTGYFQRNYESIKMEFKSSKEKKPSEFHFTYNPQGIYEMKTPKIKIEKESQNSHIYTGAKPKIYKQIMTGYPKNLLEINQEKDVLSNKNRLHPTQKPVELLEYLVKTYSNEGEIVLDSCMGSGSTGIACINTNRNFIGIELDDNYFYIAENRINQKKIK